ncbi:MAG: hypothetical protein ACXWUP_14155 [Allosphingosinicella sp.]
MTSPLRSPTAPLLFAAGLLASALLVPGIAAAEPGERAVAACRAELMTRFGEGEIRHYRVASISGSSRRTRVSFIVNADRRYTFECAAGRDGRVDVASLDPPRSDDRQLAARQR